MKHWWLWLRWSGETAVSPTERFYSATLTFPTEICFANSSTQKFMDAAWQTTDILNTGATPRPCQQLAICAQAETTVSCQDQRSAISEVHSEQHQRLSCPWAAPGGKAVLSSSQISHKPWNSEQSHGLGAHVVSRGKQVCHRTRQMNEAV